MRTPQDVRQWPLGAQSALPSEQVGPQVLGALINGAFIPSEGGVLGIGPRPGLAFWARCTNTSSTVDLLSLTSNAELLTCQGATSGGTATVNITTAGVSTALSLPASISFTAVVKQAIVANQTNYVASIALGGIFKYYAGTQEVLPWGITAPANAPTAASGGAGTPNGTYDFKVTWYDSVRGIESSPSSSVSYTTSGAETITVARNNGSVPTGVDQWRLYARKSGLMSDYYLVTTTATATTSLSFTSSDTALNALIIRIPQATENNPPPSTLTGISLHLGRVFGGVGQTLYWSQPGRYDHFDTTNDTLQVGEADEGIITATLALSPSRLLIFKALAIWALDGDTPENWVLSRVTKTDGCTTSVSLAYGEGLIVFCGRSDIYVWDGRSPTPQGIGRQLLLEPRHQAGATLTGYVAPVTYDPTGRRFLISVSVALEGQTCTLLSWSAQHQAWEGGWTLGPTETINAMNAWTAYAERVFVGLGKGIVAYLDPLARTDLAANSTGANLFYEINSGATTASFTISEASTFPVRTTGTSLVTIVNNATGEVLQTTYSASGTATKTISSLGQLLATAPPEGSIAAFDLPVLQLQTGAYGAEDHTKKRFLLSHVAANTTGDLPLLVYAYTNGTETVQRAFTATIAENNPTPSTASGPSLTGALPQFRQRIGLVGQFLRLKIVGWYPSAQWVLTRIGVKVARWSR